ncbi:MAG: ammonium transporter, Amt family [Solirubrobacterales bacterium]|jgi:Amt family ammonium transporter|nr:ammonium transporter, Amt family [Solirubrobacterales bacterium]
MKRRLMIAAPVAAIASLVLPGAAFGAEAPAILETPEASINAMWVIVAACLVMFMQAGFLLLEVGFSRAKNAGAGVAKVLVNFSIASLCYWACGFALAFGGLGEIAGTHGFFLDVGSSVEQAGSSIPFVETYSISPAAFMFFQFVFCAVSLAIVWGATLERIKFGAYVIYAIIFSAVLYPILSHWIFGGGWLQVNVGMQDFAGSTVVHLIGATGAFAALLLLGPRIGKYTKDGKPRAIPGHSMPLVGLGVLILWLGWFGFNPGSTLGAIGGRFAEVVVVTNLAAAAGVVAAVSIMWMKTKTIDIGMAGNGAIAGLVAITAPSGYVEYWAAPIIGAIAGVIVVYGVLAIEKVIDDPVGALSAHGLAGIWGTLSCGIFTSPRLAELNEVGDPGLWYSGSFHQLGAQALGVGVAFVCVFVVSYAIFFLIKKTIGLRVTAEEEDAGLDISEHGMYGYPEQFIPQPEYSTGAPRAGMPPAPAPAPSVATPMTSES